MSNAGVVRRTAMYLSIDERSGRLLSGALLGTIACRSRRRERMSAVGWQVEGLLTPLKSDSLSRLPPPKAAGQTPVQSLNRRGVERWSRWQSQAGAQWRHDPDTRNVVLRFRAEVDSAGKAASDIDAARSCGVDNETTACTQSNFVKDGY